MQSADSVERTSPPRGPEEQSLRVAGPRARETFRTLLVRSPAELPLTEAAVDLVVTHAQITNWRAGQRITWPGDSSDFVHFLVAGAVRLDLGAGKHTLTAAFVPPGRFVGGALPVRVSGLPFFAVAHVASLVAVVSHDTMRRVVDTIRVERALKLMGQEIAWLQRLASDKCRLASMQICDRLARELAVLARDFGRPAADGVVIDLPLIHSDLAKLVVASRANVTRALGLLRRTGRIEIVSRRIVLRPPLAAG